MNRDRWQRNHDDCLGSLDRQITFVTREINLIPVELATSDNALFEQLNEELVMLQSWRREVAEDTYEEARRDAQFDEAKEQRVEERQ